MYRYPDAVVQVFCKTPLLGKVKTRLQTALSDDAALAVHVELSRRTLNLVAESRLCPVELWCTPTSDHPFFYEVAQHYGLRLFAQVGRDLGERMQYALADALTRYRRAVLIGCDCPSLTVHDIEASITALNQQNAAVYAPAEDGGYVLVGLSRMYPELFLAMPWGTSRVMEITRQRLEDTGIPYTELGVQWDVDLPSDYWRYRKLCSSPLNSRKR